MRVLTIVHQADAGPGVFADVLSARGAQVDEWVPPDEDSPPRDARSYDAVIVFGGAMHADQEERHPWLRDEKTVLGELLDAGTPLLGVCLGSQLVAEAAGGVVHRASRPEIGWRAVTVTPTGVEDPLLAPLAPRFEAFQWHAYEFALPPAALPLARSDVCLQAFRAGAAAWGIQFHAEVSREDALAWIDDTAEDQDAVAAGVDPAALRERTERSIDAWNETGRELCGRFLDVAEAATRE